jgi:mediator of RNA polymerase II transcription subunit 5
MIQAYPAIQPPESLLVNLSSSPALISAITSKITPSALFALAVEHMVETSEDPNIISEDPQGSMTRFGEGLLFVETLAAQYQVNQDCIDFSSMFVLNSCSCLFLRCCRTLEERYRGMN